MTSRILPFFSRLFSNSGITFSFMKVTFFAFLLLAVIGCGAIKQPVDNPPTRTITTSVAITFYGDSITHYWDLPTYFPGKNYANTGEVGVTAEQLIENWNWLIPPTHPNAVVVLGGTNDITNGDNAAHVFSLLTTVYGDATAAGYKVVICTVLPRRADLATGNAEIVALNVLLRNYAAANNIPLADYYPAVVDPATGELQAQYAADNIHPNAAGYAVMTPIVQKAISELN